MSGIKRIHIISRESRLARLQVEEVVRALPTFVEAEIFTLPSWRDRHKEVSLLENPPTDMFTREMDQALLEGRADIAVHSAKDLPYPLPQGIEVIALTRGLTGSDSLVSRSGLTLEQLPAGACVATSSPTRRRELLKLRPDLVVAGIRGTIEERLAQVDEGKYDALIVATCALQRLGLDNRITEILPFDTHPLQGHLAVTARIAQKELQKLFAPLDILRYYGEVKLVGFGPGDPRLLTRAAEEAIRQADIVFYDDLTNQEYVVEQAREAVYVGKRYGIHHKEQEDINRLLLDAARSGKNVVRLKGGDPMIFAHGGEEVDYLESNFIRVSVIPGISAANALAALTRVPLTYRGVASSVAFVSGYGEDIQVPQADTLVYYMGARNLCRITCTLLEKGVSPQCPVLLVYNVSAPDQQEFYTTVGELATGDSTYPTPLIMLAGEVAALHRRPLRERQKVLVTGSDAQRYGGRGEIVHTPLIRITAPVDARPLEEAIHKLPGYHYLLFTSRYAVDYFFKALGRAGYDSRRLAGVTVVSIGDTTTAALRGAGITPDHQPVQDDSYGVASLFRELAAGKGNRVLIPRSDLGLPVIPERLKELGYEVDTVIAYCNRLPADAIKVDLHTISAIVLTSPSCVERFKELYREFPPGKEYILRGPITREAFERIAGDGHFISTVQAHP